SHLNRSSSPSEDCYEAVSSPPHVAPSAVAAPVPDFRAALAFRSPRTTSVYGLPSTSPPDRDCRSPASRVGRRIRQSEEKSEGSSMSETHIGRNDPCPCGSGRKFKKCCMQPGVSIRLVPRDAATAPVVQDGRAELKGCALNQS